jgi:asparagine synthase (glutamine-hydrolysing)
MCGIFGAIGLTPFEPADYPVFQKLTDLVAYRGPDDHGCLAFDGLGNRVSQNPFNIFLGHRRLAIIDLSSQGRQPMTADGRLWIVFNGEIYNYLEIRGQLEPKYQFFSRTDTEVILHAYTEWGLRAFEKFNGMWALALLDLENNLLLLSRDRFGVKPIYFVKDSNKIFFASEIKQLLPLINNPKINHNVMSTFLYQSLVDYDLEETFFREVKKVKPRHCLVINLASLKQNYHKYWEYSPPDSWAGISENEACEEMRRLLVEAVEIRLRSEVMCGTLLSGGLDSSSISTLAAVLTGGNHENFSITSRDKKYSEEPYIDTMIARKRIKVYKLPFEPEAAWSDLQKVVYFQDEPFAGLSTVAHYQILEQIKANTDIKVVLSGQGGDESLMGYAKYLYFNAIDLVKHGSFLKAIEILFKSFLNKTMIWQFSFAEAKRYLSFLHPGAILNYITVPCQSLNLSRFNTVNDRQRQDLDYFSVPALVHYEDRNSAAHSLEIRLPFLDYRLVDLLVNLPSALKLKNGWSKYILRQALKELPPEIRWRRDKQGFLVPDRRWLKEDFSPQIFRLFQYSRLGELGFIDDRKFLAAYERFRRNDPTIWHIDISRVIIGELWARTFLSA